MAEKVFERLPKTVRPTLYNLELNPDLKKFTFSGKETVSIEILQPVNRILLNSKELKINSANVTLLGSNNQCIDAKITLRSDEDILELSFTNDLPTGKAELRIEFDGELNDKMIGFYRSKYNKISGEDDTYSAVTQFEACDARRAFPCWDEPAIKAEFDVSLVVDSTLTALSNMPVKDTQDLGNGKNLISFDRTPIMSTYLVAFVVGNYEYVEDTCCDNTLVRVYTPPGKKEQGQFALSVGTKILQYYKDYFQIAYPLPKLDMIAIAEFSPGAMENWGLITYREQLVLVDENNSSGMTKQNVASVVGHELAHQWFGNLVTMEWWTHLWLNEGYASFVPNLCLDELFPEYDMWSQFVTDMYCPALELDALDSSHPIEVEVNNPSEVDEIFDEISYNKGSSVIRMLHRYIGDEDFRKGMNRYLTRYAYRNTHTEDLWMSLEEASAKPISKIMPLWTKQVGFPVITVKNVKKDEKGNFSYDLEQKKFCMNRGQKTDGTTWMVPITFSIKSQPDKQHYCEIMEGKEATITVPNIPAGDWVKLNQETVGIYRTKYPICMIREFLPSIKDRTLPPVDRLGILDDSYALAKAGETSTVETLEILSAMENEDDYTVWCKICSCLFTMYSLILNRDDGKAFAKYASNILRPIYNKLGVEHQQNDSHLTRLLRNLVLNTMLRFGVNDYESVVREKFEMQKKNINSISADDRVFVYKSIMALDGQKALDQLIEMYKNTDSQEEKTNILKSFTAINKPEIVDEVLEKVMNADYMSSASVVIAIMALATSSVARDKCWAYMQKNYQEIYERFQGGFLISRIVKSCIDSFASMEKAKEIEDYFATQNVRGLERVIQQSVEYIRNDASWLDRDYKAISKYVSTQ